MRRLGSTRSSSRIGLIAGAAGGYWYARAPAGSRHPTVAPKSTARRGGPQDCSTTAIRAARRIGRRNRSRTRTAATGFRFTRTRRCRSSPAAGRSRRRGGRPAQDPLLPQPHGPAGHLAGAEEGLDGDGLHPGLRGRGAGRRQDRQGQPRQGAAQRRAHRAGRGAHRSCGRSAPSARSARRNAA